MFPYPGTDCPVQMGQYQHYLLGMPEEYLHQLPPHVSPPSLWNAPMVPSICAAVDYISGPSNPIADSLSCNFNLNWSDQLANIMPFLPQHNGLQVWTPSGQVVSAVTSALLRKQSRRKSLQNLPLVPLPLGTSGVPSPVTWASTPFSKTSQIKYHSYRSLPSKFVAENYLPAAVWSGLDRLKITYGTLPRRS
jgi:hypothetical protein